MKNKTILVTEENINQVMGMVKKFFWTKKPHNFEDYHNFDSGWRNELPYPSSKKEWSKRKKESELYREDGYIPGNRIPISIEIDKHDFSWNTNSFIRVRYPKKEGHIVYPTVIEVGNTICLNRGNYLVIRKKWTTTEIGDNIFYYIRRVQTS